MRMRKKAWARPELEQCPYFIRDPKAQKGKWNDWFPKKQALHLELGCGKCIFTAELAAQHPEFNYIAIDLSRDMLGVARRNFEARYQQNQRPVENVALTAFDIERITEILGPEDSIEKLYINFCNPWPKVRHHKKRLTYPKQLEQYKTFMKSGAELHFKTDNDDLYLATLRYFAECGLTVLWKTTNLHHCGDSPQCNILTEHEERFTAAGIPIKAIVARFP